MSRQFEPQMYLDSIVHGEMATNYITKILEASSKYLTIKLCRYLNAAWKLRLYIVCHIVLSVRCQFLSFIIACMCFMQ
jgi:hypothetical protein